MYGYETTEELELRLRRSDEARQYYAELALEIQRLPFKSKGEPCHSSGRTHTKP